MHWSLSTGISTAVLLAAVSTPTAATAQALEVDLEVVVRMPVAVADALDAGVPEDDLAVLARSLVDGGVPPAGFIEVVTRSPSVYEVDYRRADDRRAATGPGLGAYVQRQLDRGLRGPELARAIHRELNRRGVPAGPKGRSVGARGARHVPPGQLKKRGPGKGIPPGHAKARGRGHGKGHGKGPPPHARGGKGHPGKGHGKTNGGGR